MLAGLLTRFIPISFSYLNSCISLFTIFFLYVIISIRRGTDSSVIYLTVLRRVTDSSVIDLTVLRRVTDSSVIDLTVLRRVTDSNKCKNKVVQLL